MICGGYVFEFSVSKDMKKKRYNKGGGNAEGSNTLMSNINCNELKISVEHGRVATTLDIIFSVVQSFMP